MTPKSILEKATKLKLTEDQLKVKFATNYYLCYKDRKRFKRSN